MKKMALTAALVMGSTVAAQAVTIPAAGLDLKRGQTEDNSVQVFSEATGVSDGVTGIVVDYLVGTNIQVGETDNGVNTFTSGHNLVAGTYNSFLVHYDPLAANSVSNVVLEFSENIVALILSNGGAGTQLLAASDGIFGTAQRYDNHLGRRTEDNDLFTLVSATSLSVSLSTSAVHIDNIRVITEVAPVPLPASLPLLIAGFAGLAAVRRRSTKA